MPACCSRLAHPKYADSVPVATDIADIGDDLEREKAELEKRAIEEELRKEEQEAGGATATPEEESNKSKIDTNCAPVYRPREALLNALRDWLSLMLQVSPICFCSATNPLYNKLIEYHLLN